MAGVYDIRDHYFHERKRGVEKLSAMARSMHGWNYFPQYSPTQIVNLLLTSGTLSS